MSHSQLLERELLPDDCLDSTSFIDTDDDAIREISYRVAGAGEPTDRAVRIFNYVRDQVQYEFRAKLSQDEYKASRVIADGRGFCVQKAVLLSALLRAADIPAAIVLCDLKDHTLPPRIVEAMGTETMFHHGLNAIFLDNCWQSAGRR